MSAALARRALEASGIGPVTSITPLAAGNSSMAWLASVRAEEIVVRTPLAGSGRRPSARAEVLLGELLPGDLPVPRWRTVEVDEVTCTIARRLHGRAIADGHRWSDALIADVARVLGALHRLTDDRRIDGWGPLANCSDRLGGISPDEHTGVLDRWFLAPISDFDSVLGRDRSLVHSDLHAQHILIDRDGRLAGLLDFGDAFIGSAAWDIALLGHYFGHEVAAGVASNLPSGEALVEPSRTLSSVITRYKEAKRAGHGR